MMKININVFVSLMQTFKSEFVKHMLSLPKCQTVMCCLLPYICAVSSVASLIEKLHSGTLTAASLLSTASDSPATHLDDLTVKQKVCFCHVA